MATIKLTQPNNVVFVLEAFGKVLIGANNLVDLKQEQDEAVNCSLQEKDVLAVMPTETAH